MNRRQRNQFENALTNARNCQRRAAQWCDLIQNALARDSHDDARCYQDHAYQANLSAQIYVKMADRVKREAEMKNRAKRHAAIERAVYDQFVA